MGKYSKHQKMVTRNWLILLLFFITAAAVCISLWALFFRAPEPTLLTPDRAPAETEAYAQTIPNDSGEKKRSEGGGGNVSLTYSNEVIIDLSDEAASLLFANPRRSNQDMIIQIIIQEQIIVQSGTLTAGHQVKTLDLLDGAAEKLSPGGYDGNFRILYYSQETGEKAIVNTEIPIHINVIR